MMNQEDKIDVVIENIPFGVCLRNREGRILHYNKNFLEIFELGESILEENLNQFLDTQYISFVQELEARMWKDRQHIISEYEIDTKRGKKIIEINKAPVIDLSNQIIGIISLFRDITDVKSKEREVKKLAYTDWLTQLFNRRGLYNYIEAECEEKPFNITMMFIDLDNFKLLNDSCGHYYGDEALICLAKKLENVCKEAFVARVGGDEFVVVWKEMTRAECISKKADEILEVMKTEFRNKDKLNIVSASIGIVQGNTTRDDVNSLLIKGDLALYKAKEKGKNQYVFYSDKLEEERLLRLAIEKDLQEIIEKKEIMLYYQPQYSRAGKIKGFEALFRWNNEKYSKVPVIEIIKTIEKSNLMDAIGECIIKEACHFAKSINKETKEKIVVSINLSAVQIMNPGFIEKMNYLIEETEADPQCLGIEITETVLLEDFEGSIEKIQQLRDKGLTIALDDFGTGYSSFNYLVQLPLSQVKIDKKFIEGMRESEQYTKLIRLMTDGAHSLGLSVVAEGVENREQLEGLIEMNIDYIQGYLFSKPLPEDEAKKLLENQRFNQ